MAHCCRDTPWRVPTPRRVPTGRRCGFCRGTPWRAPTFRWRVSANHNDPVQMVGHYDQGIQGGARAMSWNLNPTFLGNLSGPGRAHLALDNFSKQETAVMRADCYVIPPRACVIVSLQTEGTAVMFLRIVCHFDPQGHAMACPYAAKSRSLVWRKISAGLPITRSASSPPAARTSDISKTCGFSSASVPP